MKTTNRTLIATILTAVAIAVPCAAWYVVGGAATRREAERVRNLARLDARQMAVGLAERLGGRLEGMRDTESRRPPYHYEPHFHDPTSDCACSSITPSPLAQGPGDPLIWTYFQVDQSGILTLPTYPRFDTGQDDADPRWLRDQEEIHAALLPLAPVICEAAGPSARCSGSGQSGPPMRVDPAGLLSGDRVLALENEMDVEVGTLAWHTFDVDGSARLATLRVVTTSGGAIVQGFVVSSDAVNQSLTGASHPAAFVPGPGGSVDDDAPGVVPAATSQDVPAPASADASAASTIDVPVNLPGAPWLVRVDASDAIGRAAIEGDAVVSRFHRTFAWVALAALLAGMSVIGLVWQTDRLSRERSRFAASAAHELRTPLAGLRVYADMLSEGLGDPAQRGRYAKLVASETERLGRVVANVLGYSRLERGAIHVKAEPGNIGDAVRDVIERLRPAIESAGATIDLAAAEALPTVAFDRDALFHIVQNLLDNAEKFSRDATDRTIRVRLEPGEREAVILSVIDHGPGIATEARRRLFRPFTRVESPDAPPGLGLGLTLVRALTEAHDGRVTYTPGPDGGSVFTVVLPSA